MKPKSNLNNEHIEMSRLERNLEGQAFNPFEEEDFMDDTSRIMDNVLDRPNRVTSIHRNASYGPSNADLKYSYLARAGGGYKPYRNMGNYLEKHAVEIVTKMERDPQLMEDSPSSELLRREALRDMPQCLTIKRRIKAKLTKSVSQKIKRKPISCYKRLKYYISMRLTKLQVGLKDLAYTLELWYSPLKKIEGHFGSGVVSYFRFLRWIFLLNVFIAVLPLAFIVTPQAVYLSLFAKSDNDTKEIGNATKDIRENFRPLDVVSGEGYFTNTLLYYGFYDDSISMGHITYSMAFAYFFTMVFIYAICLLFSSISAAWSYRKYFIETEGGLKNIYAQKIFCGWDFSIVTKEAAELKSASLYQELKELIAEQDVKSTKKSCLLWCWTKTKQIIIHLLVIVAITGVGYFVWNLKNNTSNYLATIELAAAINVIMLALPVIFSFIVRFEDYKSPRVTLGVTLFRSYVLGAVIVAVLVEFWLTHTKSHKVKCREKTSSWETCLGQEMYRLIIFDFIFSVILTGLFNIFLFIFSRLLKKKPFLELDIASNTLQIIFNETLLWIGLVFAPLLVVVVIIKLFIMWYIKYLTVFKLCRPPTKTWRAAQTQTWFRILTFLSCLLVISIHGYIFLKIKPSEEVGPFRGLDYVYQLLMNVDIYGYQAYSSFYQPAVVTFILIAMGIRVYYLRAKCHAQRSLVEILREMLVLESKDKEFLLQHISRATKGQWKYRLQRSQLDDPINNPPEIYGRRKSRFSFKDISEESSGNSLDMLINSPGPSTSGISLSSMSNDDSQLDNRWTYKKFS